MAEQGRGSLSLADLCTRRTTLYLDCDSGRVVLRGAQLVINETTRLQLVEIRRLVLIGRARVEPELLYQALRSGICVDWLDRFGKPVGLLLPLDQDAYACCASQGDFCRSEGAFQLAKSLILAKVDNCHEVMRRRAPHCRLCHATRERIAQADNAASLRGQEGAAAHEYFALWGELLPGFGWQGRKPHPAPDPVNMLLSTGYGLLRNRLASALRHAGLNPRQGFFHEARGRHTALASDLMEPLRALVDTRVLSLLRRHRLEPDAFATRGSRCVCASGETFAHILREFEEMFAKSHKFYVDPGDNDVLLERSLNDMLDDLAESFALHVHDGAGCLVPRLAPCHAV